MIRLIAALPVLGLAIAASAQTPTDLIAITVRDAGHACETPKHVEKDETLSKPDQEVWTIECEGGSYRVIYPGDDAPRVERI